MAVTNDYYEFPVAVSRTKRNLSLQLGMNPSWAARNVELQRKGSLKSSKYKVVEVWIEEGVFEF